MAGTDCGERKGHKRSWPWTGSCQNSERLEAKPGRIQTGGVTEASGILFSESSDSPVYIFDKKNGNSRAAGQQGICGSSQRPHEPGFRLRIRTGTSTGDEDVPSRVFQFGVRRKFSLEEARCQCDEGEIRAACKAANIQRETWAGDTNIILLSVRPALRTQIYEYLSFNRWY